MLDGHFDFGNGYHGQVYLNPHQLFRYPSTIWRFAQDLIELMPASMAEDADVVAGPVTGGALLAHTIAGLLDSRRALTQPARLFAPFATDGGRGLESIRPGQNAVTGRPALQSGHSAAGTLSGARYSASAILGTPRSTSASMRS